MKRQAHIVVDLGFGDSGKGTVTDSLVRYTGASLVVRFNGGAQAGHTVVLKDGRSHTFSQFGAGTFVPGTHTHLSRFMLLHPGGLLEEARLLSEKGVHDALQRLSIDPEALVISPFQQSANRLRELSRGEQRHGSCGLGIGETAQDALECPEQVIRAKDLGCPSRLRAKLQALQQKKWSQFAALRKELVKLPQGAAEFSVLESANSGDLWVEQAGLLAERVRIAPAELPERVVFEGAQGVLLDEWRGFHPHTTWSRCTFENALELLEGWEGETVRWGVMRSYATRHGAGPLPTEDERVSFPELHNANGPWQGAFRQGWLDLVMTRYAVECCGGVDALALTHWDHVGDVCKVATGYRGVPEPYYQAGRLVLGTLEDLVYQEALGRALGAASPVYEELSASALPDVLQQALGGQLALLSRGPTPESKEYYLAKVGESVRA